MRGSFDRAVDGRLVAVLAGLLGLALGTFLAVLFKGVEGLVFSIDKERSALSLGLFRAFSVGRLFLGGGLETVGSDETVSALSGNTAFNCDLVRIRTASNRSALSVGSCGVFSSLCIRSMFDSRSNSLLTSTASTSRLRASRPCVYDPGKEDGKFGVWLHGGSSSCDSE